MHLTICGLDAGGLHRENVGDRIDQQARRAVDAALGSSLGELDVRGTTDERFGHRTAHWFALTVNCSVGDAKKRVQVGRRLRRLEFVAGALADGSVSFEHARVVSDLAAPRTARIVEDLQTDMVRLAGVLAFERWRSEVKGLVDLADGDGSFRPGPENSTLRMTTGFGGSVELAGTLTALDGAALREAADHVSDKGADREIAAVGARDEEVVGAPRQQQQAQFVFILLLLFRRVVGRHLVCGWREAQTWQLGRRRHVEARRCLRLLGIVRALR